MNSKIKQLVSENLQPFFDELIESCCKIYQAVYDNLPANMPAEEKNAIVQGILEQQRESLVNSVKSAIPADFEKQLKEAFNGGK